MNEQFVTVRLPPILTRFPERMAALPEQIIEKTAPILRSAEEASIRKRWYRRGRTLRSLKDDIKKQGSKWIYRLFPTTFYAAFGEWGTGRRGAQSGSPAPRGWKYGKKAGMTARRYSRIAVHNARPRVIDAAQQQIKEFARNVTVK